MHSKDQISQLQEEAEEYDQYQSEIRGNETPPSFEAWQQANEEHMEKVNKIGELGNYVGNGELFEAGSAARELEKEGIISSDLRLRIERLYADLQNIHGEIWNAVAMIEDEPVIEKKVVLLQKEETVEKDGIRFRVIASGVEEDVFEYEIQGPDGDTITAEIAFSNLDQALEQGKKVALSLDPEWYRQLRKADREEEKTARDIVRSYGFVLEQTGGGCKAYIYYPKGEGNYPYYMLTDDSLSAFVDAPDNVMYGEYKNDDDEGDILFEGSFSDWDEWFVHNLFLPY
jgi:hypothetical protein